MIILTKPEKRGLLFLAVILLASFGIELMLPSSTNRDLYDYTLSDSLFDVLSADTLIAKDTKSQKISSFAGSKNKQSSEKAIERDGIRKIDINHASSAELELLPGIGPKTAERIIAYRRQNGFFRRYDDLLNVNRIGTKTLKKLKPFLLLGKRQGK